MLDLTGLNAARSYGQRTLNDVYAGEGEYPKDLLQSEYSKTLNEQVFPKYSAAGYTPSSGDVQAATAKALMDADQSLRTAYTNRRLSALNTVNTLETTPNDLALKDWALMGYDNTGQPTLPNTLGTRQLDLTAERLKQLNDQYKTGLYGNLLGSLGERTGLLDTLFGGRSGGGTGGAGSSGGGLIGQLLQSLITNPLSAGAQALVKYLSTGSLSDLTGSLGMSDRTGGSYFPTLDESGNIVVPDTSGYVTYWDPTTGAYTSVAPSADWSYGATDTYGTPDYWGLTDPSDVLADYGNFSGDFSPAAGLESGMPAATGSDFLSSLSPYTGGLGVASDIYGLTQNPTPMGGAKTVVDLAQLYNTVFPYEAGIVAPMTESAVLGSEGAALGAEGAAAAGGTAAGAASTIASTIGAVAPWLGPAFAVAMAAYNWARGGLTQEATGHANDQIITAIRNNPGLGKWMASRLNADDWESVSRLFAGTPADIGEVMQAVGLNDQWQAYQQRARERFQKQSTESAQQVGKVTEPFLNSSPDAATVNPLSFGVDPATLAMAMANPQALADAGLTVMSGDSGTWLVPANSIGGHESGQ